MKNIKKVAVSTSAAALAGLMAFGGAHIMAYLTDSETTTNTFTVGKITVDLEEPNYPGNGSDEVTNLVPNEEVNKDPQVENTGDNNLVAFLKIYSPVALVETAQDNGTKNDDFGPNEIFWMKSDSSSENNADSERAFAIGSHANAFSKDWTRMEAKETSKYYQAQDQEDGTVLYAPVTDAVAKAALWAAKFYHAVPQSDGSVIMQSVAAADIPKLPADEKVYTLPEAKFADAQQKQFHYTSTNSAGNASTVAAEIAAAGFTEVPKTAAQEGEDCVQKRLDDARIYESYVFGHNTQLEPKDVTDAIFDKVQLKNIIEGEIDTRTQNIVIETYAIQSENVLDSGAALNTADGVSAEEMSKIYDTFVNQATAGMGDEANDDLYKNVESKDANITPTKDLDGNMADVTTKRLEISIDKAKIQVGKSQTITPTASTNGVEEAATGITYASENKAIATVDASGKVTGVAIGTTFIDATWQGATAKIEVTVVNPVNP